MTGRFAAALLVVAAPLATQAAPAAAAAREGCDERGPTAIWWAPLAPVAGAPLKVLAAVGAADPGAHLPQRLPGAGRGRPQDPARQPGGARLRRPAVFPARLLRLEAGTALRVPRLRPRHREPPAPLHGVLHERGRARGRGG